MDFFVVCLICIIGSFLANISPTKENFEKRISDSDSTPKTTSRKLDLKKIVKNQFFRFLPNLHNWVIFCQYLANEGKFLKTDFRFGFYAKNYV